jgi:hypothetical protein
VLELFVFVQVFGLVWRICGCVFSRRLGKIIMPGKSIRACLLKILAKAGVQVGFPGFVDST